MRFNEFAGWTGDGNGEERLLKDLKRRVGMASNIKQVIYFHHRLDATAATIRNKRSHIDMLRRDFSGPIRGELCRHGAVHTAINPPGHAGASGQGRLAVL
jgi:hypothetical protein